MIELFDSSMLNLAYETFKHCASFTKINWTYSKSAFFNNLDLVNYVNSLKQYSSFNAEPDKNIVKILFGIASGEIVESDFHCIGDNCSNFLKASTILAKHHCCSRKCTSNNKVRKQKIEETFLTRYGVKNPRQIVGVTDRIKKTCLEKYGVEHHMQAKEILDKARETCLDRYGVAHPAQSAEVQQATKETCLKKYGVENPSQVKEIRAKADQTTLKRFGVSNVYCLKEVQDKSKQTRENQSWELINSFSYVKPAFNREEYFGDRKSYRWKCIFCGKIFKSRYVGGIVTRKCKCRITLR